jgi:hypothetical protein
MYRKGRVSLFVGFAAGLWACGGGESGSQQANQQQGRDLTLAPAESVAKVTDAAKPGTTAQPAAQPKQPATQPKTTPPPARPQPKPAAPMLAQGTSIELTAADSINSRHNKAGEPVTATSASAVKDAQGRTVIPAGAVFLGTISDIATAHPGGQGRLVLTFSRVQFGGKSYGVQARVDTMATVMKGRGVTGAEAAKVGAGAVVGAIAGRLIGGNKKGTAVGAAAGTAAGVGVAAETREVDIILPAGAMIKVVLTAPFTLLEVAS